MDFSRIKRDGFTLVEALMSLMITLIIVVNCMSIFNIIKVGLKQEGLTQSLENGMVTLSYELRCAHEISYGDTLIYKDENNEECTVYLLDSQLIIKPGTNIICRNIDSVYFYEQDNLIYTDITSNEKTRTFLIGSNYETTSSG